METTGRVRDIYRNEDGRKYIVTFEADTDISLEYEKLKNNWIDIRLVRHKEKRSLDANGYYWKLLTEVAHALRVSNSFIHNKMINDYGQPLILSNKLVYVVIPDNAETEESQTYHLKPTSQVKKGTDGLDYRTYILMRGSSDYNSEEMSRLIEGLVSTAKELGIETLTPEQLARDYGVVYEKHNAERQN